MSRELIPLSGLSLVTCSFVPPSGEAVKYTEGLITKAAAYCMFDTSSTTRVPFINKSLILMSLPD